ncbi:hypothetical protein PIB30_082646 [Stylosanthes scabra]|uniref:Uncharacterized protein n=1 Tax=Stylosanthes scabra TaxID=79078 RepID=A0ABU6WQB2_9FABA|nr:hypothetical protein [Stylosanthes scabra]
MPNYWVWDRYREQSLEVGNGSAFGGYCHEDDGGQDDVTWEENLARYESMVVDAFQQDNSYMDHVEVNVEEAFMGGFCFFTTFRELFYGIREKGYPSDWIPDDIFKQLKEYWASDEYMDLKRTNKANRASSPGGSLYTGGSIAYPLEELGRTPTQSKVFTRTHTKKKDQGQWVDRRAEEANIMMRFGLGLPVAAREVGSTDVARSRVALSRRELTQQAEEHKQEVQALSDWHAAQIRSLQSSFDTQTAEFDRWKSTVSQMYSLMQNMQAGSASSSAGMPPPMPPPPPPFQHGPSGATDQPPSDANRSPHDDPDYI